MSSRIILTDFVTLASAQSFALELMRCGKQFAFCPHPLSISYPPDAAAVPAVEPVAINIEEDQPA